jgi:osmoprotectant transport system substrate-binding protein
VSGVTRHPLQIAVLVTLAAVALVVAGCGSDHSASGGSGTTTLPGSNRPAVTIGDKNYTEQFVLGELYDLALSAQGYQVTLNPNIGPTTVTFQALTSGRLDMYPEYLDVWNTFVAGYHHGFRTERAAYRAARRYAKTQGLVLLRPTPFSDTNAVAVTSAYADANGLRSLADLQRVQAALTFGAPTQFQDSSVGLTPIERAYDFTPKAVNTLDTGAQYQALTSGTVQAAWMTSTDGELAGSAYRSLGDPQHVFGWGEVTPVVPAKVLAAEGPDFARTINRVDRLLTLKVMRQLNADVTQEQQTPAAVAQTFLQAHGLVAASSSS